MLTTYIQAAMHHATYELIDDGEFYGEIPGLDGVFATAITLEECRDNLQSVLEEWIALGLRMGHDILLIDGHTLTFSLKAA